MIKKQNIVGVRKGEKGRFLKCATCLTQQWVQRLTERQFEHDATLIMFLKNIVLHCDLHSYSRELAKALCICERKWPAASQLCISVDYTELC